MAFRFRLAPLLRHRARLEDERALALARAVERREHAAQRLAVLCVETVRVRAALIGAATAGSTGADLCLLAEAVGASARRTAVAGQAVLADDFRVAGARAELVRATRDRRMLERFESQQREARDRVLVARTQRELDDIASIYGLRRRREAARHAEVAEVSRA
jgi:flagellar export protein FliJ